MGVRVRAPDGREWAVRRVWSPLGPSLPPPPAAVATEARRDGGRLAMLRGRVRPAVGLALGLTSGTAVLALARGEGAGTQEALVGALFVAAILGTSPYWIEDFLGYLTFRAALYTAVFWVPVVVLALVVFYAFRILADRPWTVEAVSSDSPWTATRWQVRGWRRSGRIARQIAVALERGDEPLPAAADGVPETIVAGMS